MVHTGRMTRATGARDFLAGAGLFWRGVRLWSRNPRLMVTGLLPGLIVAVLFGALLFVIVGNLRPFSAWIVDVVFTKDTNPVAELAEVVVAFALFFGTVLALVYTFATVTLLVGTPFFERISRNIDSALGVPASFAQAGQGNSIWKGIGESLRRLLLVGPVGLLVFLVGLLPLVGTVIAFVLGAAFGGWFLALELTEYPLARRGLPMLAQRRAALRRRRALSLGFGTMVFVAFLVPGGAVLVMPAAVAGGTLLARRVSGESVAQVGAHGAASP
jgi:CysZ protein